MDIVDPVDIEERTVLSEPDEYSQTASSERIDRRVSVLQATFAYVVELELAPKQTHEFTVTRHYTPSEAREVARQLRNPDESALATKLGADHAEQLAEDLDIAADYASTRSIGEHVGEDVIAAYKEGKISQTEFAEEFHVQTERSLEKRDREER